MHVHVSSLPSDPILNWKLHTLWLLKTINSFAPDVAGPNKIELQSWSWQSKVILMTTGLAAACMALECTIYMYKIMLQMGMALRYASTAKSEHYDWKTVEKKHNEQIRFWLLSTSLQSLSEPEICCDGAVILLCVITWVSSIFGQYMHAWYIYCTHFLSEYQQVPQYANSGRRVKFCRQYECFNPTPLHPHLGAYASDRSKTVVLAVHEMWSKKNIYVPF